MNEIVNKIKIKIKRFYEQARATLFFSFFVFICMAVALAITLIILFLLNAFGLVHGIESAFGYIIAGALFFLVLGIIISFPVSDRPLSPIRQLINATNKIADGDYTAKVDTRRMEIFKDLGEHFNHMVDELNSVEMLRSDFINNFSHEFKTPIVSISGFAKMLKRDDLTDEERNEYIDIIINESQRLAQMSDNVMKLSKLEQQTLLTDKTMVDISEQIRLAYIMLASKWENKNIDFQFDSEEVYLEANEALLKEVWINLLDNAMKFSPVNGLVQVSIKDEDQWVIVSIANQGEHISEEKQEHIFERFYQGDTSHSTKGFGLGLTIVKRIVELHQGQVSLDQSQENTIAFVVGLPKRDNNTLYYE